MKVTAEMKIKKVLAINEPKMLDALIWLSPAFDRLRNPLLRKMMGGRVTVMQAAMMAQVPLTEALFVLNLAAGEDPEKLAGEFDLLPKADFEFQETNQTRKPKELSGVSDEEQNVIFVDVMDQHDRGQDPLPKIMKGFSEFKNTPDCILLVRHPFDPVPLRDLLARQGFASWAEERSPCDWYIYFYRPGSFEHGPKQNY